MQAGWLVLQYRALGGENADGAKRLDLSVAWRTP